MRIFIIAGEVSGDVLGARIMQEMQDAEFIGIGGENMIAAGLREDNKTICNIFLKGMSGVGNDVLPYAIYDGNPRAVYRTINRVGLMRHGFTNEDMHAIHNVYSAVFRGTEGTVAERLARVRKEVKNNKYAMDAIDFIENRSKRGIGTSKNAE